MRVVRHLAVALAFVAGVGFARAEEYKNPLEHAKAGQWARYKMQGNMEMIQSITKVEGKKVTMKTETLMDGKSLSAAETVIDLDQKPAQGAAQASPDVKTSEETVEVAGKKLKCKVTEIQGSKSYMSDEVPITGLVKSEAGGQVVMELVAWGDSAEGAGAGKGDAGKGDAGKGDAGKGDAGQAGGAGQAGDAGKAAGGDTQTATSGDVTINVTKVGPMKTDDGKIVVKGFFTFTLSASNKNAAQRTLKGKITLKGKDGNVVGEGTLYAEIPGGQTIEKKVNVKHSADFDAWEAVIEKIFEF